jgi:hypothetical protein
MTSDCVSLHVTALYNSVQLVVVITGTNSFLNSSPTFKFAVKLEGSISLKLKFSVLTEHDSSIRSGIVL